MLYVHTHWAADIVMFDGHIVIFKFIQDLHFFVTGGDDENELILASVLQGFFDAVDTILRLGFPPENFLHQTQIVRISVTGMTKNFIR
jgi:Clathrin adaptor complex small chain